MAWLLLVLACCAAPAAVAEDFDERWLSSSILEELAVKAGQGDWPGLEKRAEALILGRLACGRLDRMQGLNDLVYVHRAARYLALADAADPSRKLSAWLAGNRDVSRLLFRAMQEAAAPEEALKKFQAILSSDEKRLLTYPNLAVAFAVSQPLKYYVKQPNPAGMLESFAWFTDPKTAFRYDLKVMPYELSLYLADTQLSLSERRWVLQRYGRRPVLESTYHDVKYDMDYYYRGQPKKLTRVEYTLPNILRLGGVCIDQAYFTSEICKTLGVPSTIVLGRNADGAGHAWVASVKANQSGGRKMVEWDATTARWEQQKFYTGTLTEPASRRKIHDSELILLGSAALLPLDRREEADAATALAAMLAPMVKAPPQPSGHGTPAVPGAGADELRKLAEQYNSRAASKGGAAKVNLRQLQPVAKLDSAVVEALLLAAADRNLAHRRVWDLVLELRQAGALSNDCLDRLLNFLTTRTAKDYPDYGCVMLMQLVPTYDNPARRESAYRKAMEIHRDRPDLQGQLMIVLASDLAGQGKKDEALKVFQQVLTGRSSEVTEVLILAAQHAEALLLDQGGHDSAIGMYSKLFAKAVKPDVDGGYAQSAYYLLGTRLAELLAQAGQQDAARKVREQVGADLEPTLRTD